MALDEEKIKGILKEKGLKVTRQRLVVPVSYTHLDVYKRQVYDRKARCED